MIMVNNIGGATLSAALVAEKALEPRKVVQSIDNGANADLSASVAAYLSLPGFNATSPLQTDTGNTNGNQANALVKAVSQDETLKTALQQFDEGLKKLTLRPETQIFQARFGADAHANNNVNDNLPAPEPLPGVGKDGILGAPPPDSEMAADTNHDGKVSEEERIRYEAPLTYRSLAHDDQLDAQTNGPSAFSLAEVNRAYGAVATPEPA
ncbi:hypothetical protein SAMN05192549_104154 [Duganella sacchari]|uniref:Uncharacterized protein n=1 Tax=Duganella sacchari TaxID=551987 RepID=A0A1M7NS51_9BURK|nr:hypothetical protein [Duganella sacchari]SHN06893.1 hypothetical protein SAMN05192549_104154 [Duganella sacchari]